MKNIFLSLIILLTPYSFAVAPTLQYGQVMIHTADGGTYVVTGDMSSFVYEYKADINAYVGCMVLNNTIGLPPATNDRIFQDGFDAQLCFRE